jgi:TolB protein
MNMSRKIRISIGFLILMVTVYTAAVLREREREGKPDGIVILCAGDSVTAEGYARFLQEELIRSGKAIVADEGVVGYTPAQYLKYMKSVSLLEETDPDIVLFQPCAGDIRSRGGRTRIDVFSANMNRIVALIESYVNSAGRSPVLLLGAVPPVETGMKAVEELNSALSEMAKERNITFVDNYQFFLENFHHIPSTGSGGETGRLLAESWLKVLLPLVDAYGSSEMSQFSGQIVFQSDRDRQWEIYVMNADGSGLMRLTENECDDEYPVWSPDGREIVFKSNRDGNWEIYKMKSDGSCQVRLTHCEAEDAGPSWSPDGGKIAFHSFRDDNWDIYVMNADGKTPVRATDSPHKEILPAWSPDGGRISFMSNRIFGWQIYVMNADGNEMERLTGRRSVSHPDWSPDGSRLVCVSSRPNRKSNIRVMNADGTDMKNLTEDATDYSFSPAWSPDGGRIVFARMPHEESENSEIWVMNADGTCPVQITHDPGQNKSPDWF